ncbi:MAG TPA: response regulator [Panacibacter sp.]|nr:response regulator [Panacibacter sp.]
MKILIAEDDPVMLSVIQHQLKKDNYKISANADARDALSALETFKPDLIITDILMPFTSGLELIGIVRTSGSKIPILVVSAIDQEATVLEALSLGADDFITKPFKGKELSMMVKRLITLNKK